MLEKIKKLLDLANSNNEHEAKLASEKAQELMLKYNISMLDLPQEFLKEQESCPRMSPEDVFVNNIISDYFFVTILRGRNKLVLVGTKENIEVAKYVRAFLKQTFKDLFRASDATNRKAFYAGLAAGLRKSLDLQQAKVEGSGLVVMVNAKLNQFVENQFKVRHTNHKFNGSAADYSAGVENGQKINIRKGLGTTGASGKLLGK